MRNKIGKEYLKWNITNLTMAEVDELLGVKNIEKLEKEGNKIFALVFAGYV